MKTTLSHLYILLVILINMPLLAAKIDPKIDPIKFSMTTTATQIGLNEEFQIEIKAAYMNIPANTAFIFEGSNSFRLKLILPDGFEQTGGNFTDFSGGELSSTKPFITYNVKGKFSRNSGNGFFQLLRSHKKADVQSTFIEVARLNFNTNDQEVNSSEEGARIALIQALGTVPYLTMAQLRSGVADANEAVFITDNGRHGLFRYNSASTMADDGAMTIVSSGRRYERVYDGAVNVRWFGIVGDGVNDQSAAIQAMLNNAKYRNVFFPKATASYRVRSIRIPSNSTLTFEEGTVVEGMGNLGTSEKMMYMYDVENIIIRGYGVTFRDRRENYPSGQWRHIFSLEGVLNAVIEGMAANDSGGDGFYIGAGSVRKVSENIKFINVSADNNRRAGMSLTTGKNVDVVNAIFTNTGGEGPQGGLNVEANGFENRLEGIRISNPKTGGNRGPGVMIGPGALVGSDRIIDIVVSNHVDDGSMYGCLVTWAPGPLPGSIMIENATWKNSKLCGFVSRNWSYQACAVMLINPTVINCNTNASTSPTAGAAFYIHREATDGGDSYIGNVHILNPKIMDTRPTKLIRSGYSFRDWATTNKVTNCSIIDPIKVGATYDNNTFYPTNNMIANVELELADRHKTLTHELGNGNSIADYTYFKTFYTNQLSTATRNLTLGKVNAGFPELIVEVRSPYTINIIPNATDNIVPLSPVNGKYISSKVVGSRLRLRKQLDNSWFIAEMSGTWTVQP
ncbi:glycosyl hydrolase family 28-related protein [Dyadobacter sp. CY323]|uniref:glycosyl hydrolase family 28-related protein n=1 Tax=Dyadobacter sp. CY323 TaxID=2907302 RepID=UPI001F26FF43|nr:glycosyl hydrolase family 28-related protein [Dyadobacter sp. CY323]MCE6990966.1 hypothetical protein [Dyadobacter sp. CY323]